MANHDDLKHDLKNGDFETYVQNLNQKSLSKIQQPLSSQELPQSSPHTSPQSKISNPSSIHSTTNISNSNSTISSTPPLSTDSSFVTSTPNSQSNQAACQEKATWKGQFIVIFVMWVVMGTLAWFFMLPPDKIKGIVVISLICIVLLGSIYKNRNKAKTAESAKPENPHITNEQTSPENLRVYRFSWKRQFWGLIYLWFTLGTMMWFILPPEQRVKGCILLGLLSVVMVASNYMRRNKPLPTAKQNASMFAGAMLKRIFLMFTKD